MDSELTSRLLFACFSQRFAFLMRFGGVSSTRFQLDPIGNASQDASIADAWIARTDSESPSEVFFASLFQRFAFLIGFGGVSSMRFQLDPIGNISEDASVTDAGAKAFRVTRAVTKVDSLLHATSYFYMKGIDFT